MVETPAEVCNGLDDDHDGLTDEGGPLLCVGAPGCEWGTCYCLAGPWGTSCGLD